MDYRDLVVWQKSMELAEQVYRITIDFPIHERYGLTSQMRRAVISIPSNIAEGQGRRTTDAEFIRYLQVALGSLCELEAQCELSVRLGFLAKAKAEDLRPKANEIGRMLKCQLDRVSVVLAGVGLEALVPQAGRDRGHEPAREA